MSTQTLTYQENNGSKRTITFRVNTAPAHKLLLRIGIPAHLYGYGFIIYALELIMLDPDLLHHVTKGLYIDVAKKFKTNPSRVERAIRHAIHVAWLHGDIDFINHIFQSSIRQDKGVPTNTMFLARLYYYIINREYE